MYVPNPQTIEPEFTIEVDSFTQTIFAPTNSTFAFVKGTRHAQKKIEIFREFQKINEFEGTSSSSWSFSFNSEFLLSKGGNSVQFWSLDGGVIQSIEFPASNAPYEVQSYFARDGSFIYLGPQTEKEPSRFVVAVWLPGTPMDRLGRFEFASDIQDFAKCEAGTSAAIFQTGHNEHTFLYEADGHGGESQHSLINVIGGDIALTQLPGIFIYYICSSPTNTQLTLLEPHPNTIRCVSLPKFDNVSEALQMPLSKEAEDWDYDFLSQCDYISNTMVAVSTEYGRLFIVTTKTMQVLGEIEAKGFELRPYSKANPNLQLSSDLSRISRCQEKYLLAHYGIFSPPGEKATKHTLAFLPIDTITKRMTKQP